MTGKQVAKTEFRTAYGPRRVSKIMFLDEHGEPEPTKTVQSEKDRVNINNILNRYQKTGLIDHVAKGVAQYGDFTEVNEYQESLNKVIKAEASFAALPSKVRKEFDNDPGKFFEFATDPKNHEKLVEMGLAHVKTPPAPQKVEIVNQEPKGSEKPSEGSSDKK